MNLTTYRRYQPGYYAHLASLMTGGYRNVDMVITMGLFPGLFRVDWKRGNHALG